MTNGAAAPDIRACRPADWDAALALLAAARLPVDDLPVQCHADFLVATEPATHRIVGLVGVQQFGGRGLLRSLAIAGGLQGKGLGSRLLARAQSQAEERGIDELWLLTIDADGFFAERGFTVAPRSSAPAAIAATAEFHDLCPDDAVLMVKALSH